MKIQYDNNTFGTRPLKWMASGDTPLEALLIADKILDDYRDDGYTLTLRQLFYQFVGRGLFNADLLSDPEEGQKIYKNFGTLVRKGRDNGLLSWTAIEDRGRSLSGLYSHEEDDHEVVYNLDSLLTIDHWARQEAYVEVWVEKDALSNVIDRACSDFQVPYLATKGYLSSSEAWSAGQRFKRQHNDGKKCVMIHLGDHDPEGIDMTRDNDDRVAKYSNLNQVEVRRIALNMDQVIQYDPPPNWAKASSSRFDGYVSAYGDKCWELDALEPSIIVDLIEKEVAQFVDMDAWEECDVRQEEKRHHLRKLHTHWDEVKSFLDDLGDFD